jgi:hypothetical protein
MLLWIVPTILALACGIDTPITCLPYAAILTGKCPSKTAGIVAFVITIIFGIIGIIYTFYSLTMGNELSGNLVDMVTLIGPNVAALIVIAPFIVENLNLPPLPSTTSSCSGFSVATEVQMLFASMVFIGVGRIFLSLIPLIPKITIYSTITDKGVHRMDTIILYSDSALIVMWMGNALSIIGMLLWIFGTILAFGCNVSTPFDCPPLISHAANQCEKGAGITLFVLLAFVGFIGGIYTLKNMRDLYVEQHMISSYIVMTANVGALMMFTPFIVQNPAGIANALN